eukprot:5772483-Alexandrium_andersonii.AAC.1
MPSSQVRWTPLPLRTGSLTTRFRSGRCTASNACEKRAATADLAALIHLGGRPGLHPPAGLVELRGALGAELFARGRCAMNTES